MNSLRMKVIFFIFCISSGNSNINASLEESKKDDTVSIKFVLDRAYTERDFNLLCNEVPGLERLIKLEPAGKTIDNKDYLYNLMANKKSESTIKAMFMSHDTIFDTFKLNFIAGMNEERDLSQIQGVIFRFVTNVDCLQEPCKAHIKSNRDYVGIAVHQEHMQALQFLICAGASLNSRYLGEVPLWHACLHKQNLAITSLLLESGADKEMRGPEYTTLLHMTSGQKRSDITQALLDAECNVDAQDSKKWTPLHYAVAYGSIHNVSLLIAKEADINAKSDEWVAGSGVMSTPRRVNQTPLMLAKEMRKTKAVQLLKNAGAENDQFDCTIS